MKELFNYLLLLMTVGIAVFVVSWEVWLARGKRFLQALLADGLVDSINTVENTVWTEGKRIVTCEVHIRKSGQFEIDYVSQSGEEPIWYFRGVHYEGDPQRVEERLHSYKPRQLIAFAQLLVRGRSVISTIETDAGRGWGSKTMDIRLARQ